MNFWEMREDSSKMSLSVFSPLSLCDLTHSGTTIISIFLDHFAADVTLSSFHVALDLTQPLTASNLSFLISSLHVQLFLLDSPSSLSLCKHLIEFVLNLLSTLFSATKRNHFCSIRRLPLKNTVAHLGSLRANLHGILSIRTLTKKESLVSCSSSPITCLL